ncbi:hypothetical protein [Pseudomonas sp. 13B_3.2_Bac1]|uniref:hypothetical protein n=1 Tax=Pseudomonas sp. 13B_3.2_Bac1 TaxID=2971623 RepID=UPI0021C8CA48|nr:hypothetical protein [Pseudomonas sp. 13B_3.2_Bac1]MCU1770187.1 hypothetical protein [Pseudomonas sp. 13B_3.2_Bac1]
MLPATLMPEVSPLHKRAQSWVQEMIAREGADLHISFNLHGIFTQAGLTVESVRAECLIQTSDTPYGLGNVAQACLPRIITLGGQCRRSRN